MALTGEHIPTICQVSAINSWSYGGFDNIDNCNVTCQNNTGKTRRIKDDMTTDREKAMVAKTHDQKDKTELYLPFPSPVFAHKIPHSSSWSCQCSSPLFPHSCTKTEHKKQRAFVNVSRPAILFDEFLLQSFGKEEFSQFDELFPSEKKLLRICYPAITSQLSDRNGDSRSK